MSIKKLFKRTTFKSRKLSSKLRLIYNALFFAPGLRYLTYVGLTYDRLEKHFERELRGVSEQIFSESRILDETTLDNVEYLEMCRVIDDEIDTHDPTFH